MGNWEFKHPWFLLLLLVIPLVVFLRYKFQNKGKKALNLPSLEAVKATNDVLQYGSYLLQIVRMLCLAFLIIALARPQVQQNSLDVNNEQGIDIFMCVDVSLSMLARDLKPDRLTALKDVATTFAKERKTDRLGLLAYSAEAITKVPLTTDREIITKEIQNLNPYELEMGTAIGVGLATAVNHLKDSKAKSKVIILLTDGENNSGSISPEIAADIAAAKNIKVYTIGIGGTGESLSPLPDIFGNLTYRYQPSNLDEGLLKEIAQKTGGKYFRATNNKLLKQVYEEINLLEKSDVNALKYVGYDEKYRIFILWALAFLGVELVLRTTLYKSI